MIQFLTYFNLKNNLDLKVTQVTKKWLQNYHKVILPKLNNNNKE